MKFLGLSGSLRHDSSNTALLLACGRVCPPTCSLELFESLRDIPPFDPHDEGADVAPPSVKSLRTSVSNSQAVLIASPEYAHGIPGAFKNALDWLVGGGEFSGKPVALLNASAASLYITAALETVLEAMDAQLLREAYVQLPVVPRPTSVDNLLANDSVRAIIESAVQTLEHHLVRT